MCKKKRKVVHADLLLCMHLAFFSFSVLLFFTFQDIVSRNVPFLKMEKKEISTFFGGKKNKNEACVYSSVFSVYLNSSFWLFNYFPCLVSVRQIIHGHAKLLHLFSLVSCCWI